MERLIKWAKRIAFVVGIPFVVGGLFVGKQIKDLHDFATAAKDTVASEVEKARTTVETAKRIATEARTTSDATMKAVNTAKDSVAAVQKQVQAGQVEVSRLRDVTARADSQVLALQAQVGDNKKQITVLASRLDDISVENTSAALRDRYPGAYGQRRISTPKDGSISPASKPSGQIYMSLELVPPRPGVPASISEATIRKARATLRQSNIRVILGGVGLLSGSTGGSSTEVGRIYSCSVSKQVSGETCILYFSRNLTEKVSTIRDVLRSVKPVPDNQIVYVDPKTLTPNAQDLLRMSGLDVAVFLGDN